MWQAYLKIHIELCKNIKQGNHVLNDLLEVTVPLHLILVQNVGDEVMRPIQEFLLFLSYFKQCKQFDIRGY